MALIRCPDCKTEVSSRAKTCVKCGCPLARTAELADSHDQFARTVVLSQSHPLPAILSFFVPGLGQLIKGHIVSAVIFFGTSLSLIFIPSVVFCIAGLTMEKTGGLGAVVFFMVASVSALTYLAVYVYNIIHAYSGNDELFAASPTH